MKELTEATKRSAAHRSEGSVPGMFAESGAGF
jgi:hypothetical protein